MLDKNKVEQFITAAMKYLEDKYSQPKRLQKGYSDCSSIIQKSLDNLGLNTRSNVTVTTHRMGIEGDSRFRQIPLSQVERGDLLWWHKYVNGKYQGHVGVYLGNEKVLEAIHQGVVIKPRTRLAWQRGYRIVALEEQIETNVKVEKFKAKGKVTAVSLNVREGNSTRHKIISNLKKGKEVNIIGKAGNWFKLDSGGFVSGAYIDLINSNVIQNVPILINDKQIKLGYIVNGITYITINKKDLPVRQVFESIGADVKWEDNKVKISL